MGSHLSKLVVIKQLSEIDALRLDMPCEMLPVFFYRESGITRSRLELPCGIDVIRMSSKRTHEMHIAKACHHGRYLQGRAKVFRHKLDAVLTQLQILHNRLPMGIA